MKNIITFINDFFGRSGNHVFGATVISKLLSFIASWVALQLIPDKELGIVIYAFQIISFIIPIAGFGLHQGLIRYGAQLKSNKDKNTLFVYTFKKGFIASLILIIIVIILSFLFDFEIKITRFYIILLSFSIITHYMLELIKIQFRLQKNNKLYSSIELIYTTILVLLVFVLSYYFKELGYAISLIIVPLITVLIFIRKLNIKWTSNAKLNIIDTGFWKYGFFASLSNVTSQLLFSIDILLIGYLLKNMELVTVYKYISLIPFSLLFLSKVVIITDFVDFTEKIKDRSYINNYIRNYIKLFSIISIGCIVFIYLFGAQLLSFFDKDYANYHLSLIILTVGIAGILVLGSIFTNLLSSIGKAYVNFITTSIAVLLNIILNSYLIPIYGILGAAITSAILMWFTGILSMLCFFYFFKKTSVFDN